jgi:hypothetical protein
MLNPVIERQILEELHRLKPEQQQKVLEFARELTGSKTPKGVPSSSLLKFGGLIPKEDLDEMMKAIEEDCERIDYDEW